MIQNPIKNQGNVTGRTQSWKQAINSLTGYFGDPVTDH